MSYHKKKTISKDQSSKSKDSSPKSLSFKIFLSLIIFVGAFIILYQLKQSEAALAGEAQKAITEGTSEPYYQLYRYYSEFKEAAGEKPDFSEFNDALYRSNTFYLDASKNFAEERNALKNNPLEIRALANKVYARVDYKTLKSLSWWIIAEDQLKVYLFGLDEAQLLAPNLPVSDSTLLAVSGREPAITSRALSKSAFVDCINRNLGLDLTYLPPHEAYDWENGAEEVCACLQTGREETELVWNPLEI